MTKEQTDKITEEIIDFAIKVFKKHNVNPSAVLLVYDTDGIAAAGWGCRACDIEIMKEYIKLEEKDGPVEHSKNEDSKSGSKSKEGGHSTVH
jgi:hypothetical protein